MHDGRISQVTGTPPQLARLCRCDTADMLPALLELQSTGAANVSERGGVYTVVCRRMKKAEDLSKVRAEAGSKGGAKRKQREGVPEYEDESEGLRIVVEFGKSDGIGERDAEWFFLKCHANGWTNGGKPILDWKNTLRSWQRAGYLPSQKQHSNGNGSAPGRAQQAESVWALQNRIDAATKELLQIKNSPANRIVDPSNIRPPLKPEFKKRVAELTENIETWKKKITTTNP